MAVAAEFLFVADSSEVVRAVVVVIRVAYKQPTTAILDLLPPLTTSWLMQVSSCRLQLVLRLWVPT